MQIFTIVLLPCEDNLEILDGLKLKFNKEGYKHKVTDTTTNAHITLAQGCYKSDKDLLKIKNSLERNLIKFKTIKSSDFQIIKEKRNPNEKVNYENYWIALLFNSAEIIRVAKCVEDLLIKDKMSDTENYINEVRKMNPNSKNRKIVGDHLNLCNYCKPDKAEDAYNIAKKSTPKELYFNSIGLRYQSGNLAWKLSLGELI